MKKTIAYILTILYLIPLITFTSCGEPRNKMDQFDIKTKLKKMYGKNFYCVSEELDDKGEGTMKFKDDDGVTFSVSIKIEHSEFDFDSWYEAEENYIPNYYRSHPELFDDFYEGGHNFNFENLTMYYDSFDDIDEVVKFTLEKVNQMDRIARNSYAGIISSYGSICILPANFKYYKPYAHISIPEKGNSSEKPDEIAYKIKKDYVQILREHNDTEELSKLSNEQLSYAPIEVMKPIRYNGKTILPEMTISSSIKNRSYNAPVYCYHAKIDRKYGSYILEELLKNINWQLICSENGLIFKNADNELNIQIYSEKKHVTFNGEPYQLDGIVGYDNKQKKYNLFLSEKDFRDLFGIEFYFDQVKGTGEIIKLGN